MKLLYRFVKWAFSRGTLPYWCIFAYDTLSVLVSGLFVYTLQYGVDNLYTNLNRVGLGIGLCMVLYMLAFFIFHTFNGVLRYSSFIDLRRVAYSSFTASIAICVFHQLQIRFGLSSYILVPRFVSGVQLFITATMLMWTARMAAKALHDLYNNFGISKNVFIYGALSGAVALARSIASDPRSRYKIKGFISDNEMMTSSRISGIKVYEDSPEQVETMRKLHVQMLLVSPLQTERFTHDTKFIDALIAAKIKIMMMPPAEEWDGKSTISHTLLHEVDIEELLPRDKIEVDMEAIKKMLTGHRILITGAAGSIGSEMARQVATFKPSELILVDQAETPMHDVRLYMMNHHKDLKVCSIVGSITNEPQMEQIFAAHKPEYVLHAAAYKHVPMMEDNPAMAIQNNVFGTRVIADLAVKYQTRKFVMISTDKAGNQKVRQLEAAGKIIRLKKGLYVLDPKVSHVALSTELIANQLYTPSYVSMQTALRYYGLIPEAVYTTQSMTLKHTRRFDTPVGRFEYQRVAREAFPIGITSINKQSYAFLMATPEKALCDLIAHSPKLYLRYLKDVETYLEDDLRMDIEDFLHMDASIFERYAQADGKKANSIETLIKYLKK